MCVSGIALAGLAISAAGVGTSIIGGIMQTGAQKRAEDAREKQMNLDAARQRREVARNAIIARSVALSNATNQGASQGSGLPGGYGQISGEAGRQTVAIDQNQAIGSDLFAANRAYYSASGITGFGSGLSSLGGAIMNNAGTINRLGTYAFGSKQAAGANAFNSGNPIY